MMLAKSLQSAAGNAAAEAVYIEDVMSTFLYTGNGSTQTINNGIDLAGEGGLVWLKQRSLALNHLLMDSARGATNYLSSNTTSAQNSGAPVTFSSTGLSIASGGAFWNQSSDTYASWTFRKSPKFFDVVTWTTTNNANARIPHSLGSAPGFYVIKRIDGAGQWFAYHTSLGRSAYLQLQGTNAAGSITDVWGLTDPTSTDFGVNEQMLTNGTVGMSYVAYLFAHNAGGFGLTGTDNVISCGSYTGNGSATGPVVTLGYEPQWLLIKQSSIAGANWILVDNMRGLTADGGNAILYANLSNSEASASPRIAALATGFQPRFSGYEFNQSGQTYIYIAIRRGPMRTPTSGTSVFAPSAISADNTTISTGFPVDMFLENLRTGSAANTMAMDRLRGSTVRLTTSSTNAESSSGSGAFVFDDNTGYQPDFFVSGSIVSYAFRRAPGFFDEVCATPSYPTPITHNLGAVPKLRFEKTRTLTAEWKAIYFDGTTDEYELALNSTRAAQLQSGRPALPTSTSFVAYYDTVPIVVYLFAPVTGVQYISKFTGNGSSQTINCGFTGGARFICIKAFSTTGDWKVIDTARGIVSGNDPTLAFNTTSAEVTGTDCIDPDSSGFIVNQESTNNLNVNGVEYLVWAIA